MCGDSRRVWGSKCKNKVSHKMQHKFNSKYNLETGFTLLQTNGQDIVQYIIKVQHNTSATSKRNLRIRLKNAYL